MLLEQNKSKVEDTHEGGAGQDKTRSQVFEIGPLGLMQVTRKRVSGGLVEVLLRDLPHLRGPGHHRHLREPEARERTDHVRGDQDRRQAAQGEGRRRDRGREAGPRRRDRRRSSRSWSWTTTARPTCGKEAAKATVTAKPLGRAEGRQGQGLQVPAQDRLRAARPATARCSRCSRSATVKLGGEARRRRRRPRRPRSRRGGPEDPARPRPEARPDPVWYPGGLMAHKKGGGSSRERPRLQAKRLGVKAFGGADVTAGSIIVRQRGTRIHPGDGRRQGRRRHPVRPARRHGHVPRVARPQVRLDRRRRVLAAQRGPARAISSTHACSSALRLCLRWSR